MKAVVWHDVGQISLDTVKDPKIHDMADAIVRVTASAICGTDLHFVRGTMSDMVPGTILGHEGVGVIEELGSQVRNFNVGDRVVIPSTIGCGSCDFCRSGYYAQCDVANPHGRDAGTAFYGGPEPTGPFNGMQAEYVRVPYAHTNLVAIPPGVSDEQAVLVSDIFPTAWFGGRLADISPGDVVAILGAGPVGQLAALSARMQGAGRVLIVDGNADRLEKARRQNAETINFNIEDPVAALKDLTRGLGPGRIIDAVGVDARRPSTGPAASDKDKAESERAQASGEDDPWRQWHEPGQALRWAVESVAKAGAIGIIGVYPPQYDSFPIGAAMNRNVTIKMGNCNHRRYIPDLLARIASGAADPTTIITQQEPLPTALDAYAAFGRGEAGWTKVLLEPGT